MFKYMFELTTNMASKTLTIRVEAYNALKALQLDKESFSDTILRLSKQFSNLKDLWGKGTKNQSDYQQELDDLQSRRENFFYGRK